MKRSILTEKIARRGYHLSREYALDPLEILFVREVMRTNVVALPADATLAEARDLIHRTERPHGQHLFPLVDENRCVIGIVSRNHLLKLFEDHFVMASDKRLHEIASCTPTVAVADEPLRVVVYRMVESGFTRFPVVDAETGKQLVGMVSLEDLLRARSRNLEEERARERVLRLRMPIGLFRKPAAGSEKIVVQTASEEVGTGKSDRRM
ncbi:MAG: CBS domain-containing protein [Acidobacteriaceae bacterium]|nr:CBS domain-containing protein [Acidobacteriaceae bacterium]